jgi:hypothetical protein
MNELFINLKTVDVLIRNIFVKVKVKVMLKVCLCLTKYHAMKAYPLLN